MEIMHSKFLKLQTALLSVLLLFSVLLPQTALAAGGTTNAAAAQDTVTLVDPDTFNCQQNRWFGFSGRPVGPVVHVLADQARTPAH